MPSIPTLPAEIQAEIQAEIERTRRCLRGIECAWPEELSFSAISRTSAYDCFPYLFLPAFPGVDRERVGRLSLAGRLYANSLFVADALIDGDQPSLLTPLSVLRLQALQFESYRLLQGLFDRDSPFWECLRSFLTEFARAILLEQELVREGPCWSRLDVGRARELACGRSGVAKAAVAGLAALSGQEACIEPLTRAIDAYSFARQMFDDLCDWKQDLAHGLPSLLLARVLAEVGSGSGVAHAIYYGGHARAVLELALESLEKASEITRRFQGLPWEHVTGELERSCCRLLADIERIVGQNRARLLTQPRLDLALPAPRTLPWEGLALDALRFVFAHWRLGFGELRHIMCLRPEEGFSGGQDYHFGDVFQRALVADGLCDAREALDAALGPVLDFEVEYLLGQRLTSGVGGWSYFPSVPEIAPDADDLAQVMQVLLRTGRHADVRSFVEGPLGVLLRDRRLSDGSIETWIVPAQGRTPIEERQQQFNAGRWGLGPEPEVVANLLYALWFYDPVRFADIVRQGLGYLDGQQRPDGSWESRWYCGPYYGSYVALRVLVVADPGRPSVRRGLKFLRRAQHADGGWGSEADSDSLSTALALLGLACASPTCGRPAVEDADRAARAQDFLQARRRDDSGWEAVPFIRPRVGEAYQSRTISSLYVMKAALAWRAAAMTAPRAAPGTDGPGGA